MAAPAADAEDDDDVYYHDQAGCDQLDAYYRRVNGLTIGQSVVGGAGLVLCGVAALHILARGRDRRSIATRLVLGVLLSNLVYAITDVIPTNLNRISGALCGFRAIGPRHTDVPARCLPTAIMFFGVYCTTTYELMMVLVSTHALRTGRGEIPRPREWALHLACVGAGVAALLGFYFRCRELELEFIAFHAATNYSNHLDPAQDARLTQLNAEIHGLPGTLWGWALLPVGFAVLGWAHQRLLYRDMLGGWRKATAWHAAFEESDTMAMLGLDPTVGNRRRLLELRRQVRQVSATFSLVWPL